MFNRTLVLLATLATFLLLWPSHCEATRIPGHSRTVSADLSSTSHLDQDLSLAGSMANLLSATPRILTPPGSPPRQHQNVAPLPVAKAPEPNSAALSSSSQDPDEVPSMPPPPVPEALQTTDNPVDAEPKRESSVPDETQACATLEEKSSEDRQSISPKPSGGFIRGICTRVSRMVKKPKNKSKAETLPTKAEDDGLPMVSQPTSDSAQASPELGRRRRFLKAGHKGKSRGGKSPSLKPDEQTPGPSGASASRHQHGSVAGKLGRKNAETKPVDHLYRNPLLGDGGE
ncbi:hypothetical protein CP533_3857 [Ophiocordyceps camponoti-saundersi (nom. inval.)]|nr:hypothetical protein CP533_3857 [Ophiocordyceps camponoti-saundersi (nom. inval.)]